MRVFGILLLAAGVMALVVGAVFDPTVPDYTTAARVYGEADRIVSLQRLAQQLMLIVGGGFAFLSGAVFLAASEILTRLAPAIKSAPSIEDPLSIKHQV